MKVPETHGTYGASLFDIRWQQKRKSILARDLNKCVICQEAKDLQVHHRQYHFINRLNRFKEPWDYANELLITLCSVCHKRGHRKYKIPTKYI